MRPTLLLALLATLAITGCSTRAQPARQSAADAISGIDALRTDLPQPVRTNVADGATDFVLAMVPAKSVKELPPPKRTSQEVIDNSTEYAAEAAKVKEESNLGFWVAVGGWALGAGAVVATLVKTLGVGGPLVQVASGLLLSRLQKQHAEKQQTLASVGTLVVSVVEELDIKPVKKAISAVVTPGQEAAIRDALAQIAKAKHGTAQPT